jgi:hypothetical protein
MQNVEYVNAIAVDSVGISILVEWHKNRQFGRFTEPDGPRRTKDPNFN